MQSLSSTLKATLFVKHTSVKGNNKIIESDKKFVKSFICIDLPVSNVVFFVDFSTVVGSVWVVRLLWVRLSVGKVEFGVRMGGMVVVGSVLVGGLGLGDTVVGLVGVLIGLLHLGRCLDVGIVVGLSEGGIVVVGGNVVVKALGGKVSVVVCMCGNVAVGGIVGISFKVAVGGIVGVSGKVAVGCVVIISGEVVVGGIVGISVEVTVGGIFSFGAMAVGGGNVTVGLGFGSTVVVNVVDVVCAFCFCCVLSGGVVDPDLLLGRLRSLTKSSAGFSSFLCFLLLWLCLTHFHSPLSQSQQHFLVRLLQ